jgi:Fe-S-cluster-containing dehydrogenase component
VYGYEFYIDPSRCIGCRSCLQACEECETHRGKSMINFDFIERRESITSAAYVCWHCDEPTCAQVCPADAIKKGEDGIVHSSLKPRCIACSNCVLACPFGIPKMMEPEQQMMKCDMCYEQDISRQTANVCDGLPESSARLRPPGRHCQTAGEANEHFLFWRTENHN